MSVVTMPTTLVIGSFGMEQVSYDMTESSDATGAEAVRLFGPPRWRASMAGTSTLGLAQAADWEVLALSLRRGVNCLGVWDPGRIAPVGTMRGTLTLNAAAAAGATSVVLAGAAGTLLRGDAIQIGSGVGTSQLVKVMADVTASGGLATVNFEPALRIAFASATAVAWDRPVFYARSIGKSVRWDYVAGAPLLGGYALDLLETFS